jgi:PDZ domain-containing secreted protein
MRKILIAIGTSLAFVAGTAYAEQAEGTIEKIDATAGTIMVDGDNYRVLDEGTAGDTLQDLKEGDKVTIQFKREGGGEKDGYFNALQVDKVE